MLTSLVKQHFKSYTYFSRFLGTFVGTRTCTTLKTILKPQYLPSRARLRAQSRSIYTQPTMANINGNAWETVPASDSFPSYKIYTGPVDKPELDTREYRIIQLANGLKAVLIHDATADKAAACVDVAVGHMQDPVCGSFAKALHSGPKALIGLVLT